VHNADKYVLAARDSAEKIVDKYFPGERAQWIKINLFNVYGIAVAALVFIVLSFLITKIEWLFSLGTIRAFSSAFGLGIFSTLFVLTYVVKDPATLVAKNSPENLDNFQLLSFSWFSLLFFLNSIATLQGGFKNLLQLLVSGALFIEQFGLNGHVEAYAGTLPPYSVEILVFTLLSLLSFSQIPIAVVSPKKAVRSSQSSSKPSSSSASEARPPTPTKSKKQKDKK